MSQHWRMLERWDGHHYVVGGHLVRKQMRGLLYKILSCAAPLTLSFDFLSFCVTALGGACSVPSRPTRSLRRQTPLNRSRYDDPCCTAPPSVWHAQSLTSPPPSAQQTAEAVAQWGVDYIVLTSVDRDDISDGGAQHFAHTVELLKHRKPNLLVECLVSDFRGDANAVATLAQSGLDVYAHNVETVERLQRFVRDPRANYQQSLFTLAHAKRVNPNLYTKTSLMVGLGETEAEIVQTLQDLRDIDVDVVTFGQYLRPTERHLSVVEYVTPDTFDKYRRMGEDLGFKYVASGPMVRSSYKAGEFYLEHLIKTERNRWPS